MYVNYGRKEDFDFLTKTKNMDLTGKIGIARYGKIYRGDKVTVNCLKKTLISLPSLPS